MKAPYLRHLKSSTNLQTTYEAIRAGFVALALEKNRRATPFVDRARSLKVAASQVEGPRDLLSIHEIQAPSYIALGELKGGIDPAGADEHWKTARTALSRIHEAFARNQLKPHTFFIGAAIEPKMALEIWNFLESGIIENAANLTDDEQIASITNWLCSL